MLIYNPIFIQIICSNMLIYVYEVMEINMHKLL
jgi:hypothetical protein